MKYKITVKPQVSRQRFRADYSLSPLPWTYDVLKDGKSFADGDASFKVSAWVYSLFNVVMEWRDDRMERITRRRVER